MGNCWAFDDVRAKHEKMHMQLTRAENDDEIDDYTHSSPFTHPKLSLSSAPPPIKLMTLDDVRATQSLIQRSSLVRRTPVLKNAHIQLDLDLPCSLHLKLETLQKTGSYEIRGAVSQFATHLTPAIVAKQTVVGVAERNYILAFALVSFSNGYRTHCLMMDESAVETVNAVQRLGVEVTRVPNEHMLTVAHELEKDLSLFVMYPFEDLALISGYATVGLEVIDEIQEVDIVVVSCGAGAFLAGVAAAVKLLKPEVEVYGVEPENGVVFLRVGLEVIDEIQEVDIVVVSCGAGAFLAGVAAAVKLLKPEVEVYGVEPENGVHVMSTSHCDKIN
uniref:Tryptophan synthase beta chain-like PALP domain-containing protein n=1 Tax=Strigamia maritima TaxID=126957 RepID=T1J6V4_STRMM